MFEGGRIEQVVLERPDVWTRLAGNQKIWRTKHLGRFLSPYHQIGLVWTSCAGSPTRRSADYVLPKAMDCVETAADGAAPMGAKNRTVGVKAVYMKRILKGAMEKSYLFHKPKV